MGLFTAKKVDAEPTTRDEHERQRRERFATSSGWEELRRSDLDFGRFVITHQPTGDEYRVYRGVIEAGPIHPATAYYYAPSGAVVFLEPVRKAKR